VAVGANWLSKVASRHKLKALRFLKRKPVAVSSMLLAKQLLSHLITKSKLRAFLLIQVHATAHRVAEDLIRDKNKLYISPQYPLHLRTVSRSPTTAQTARSRNQPTSAKTKTVPVVQISPRRETAKHPMPTLCKSPRSSVQIASALLQSEQTPQQAKNVI
jgi:hypothetical protein